MKPEMPSPRLAARSDKPKSRGSCVAIIVNAMPFM
jgi:hypothetical protein